MSEQFQQYGLWTFNAWALDVGPDDQQLCISDGCTDPGIAMGNGLIFKKSFPMNALWGWWTIDCHVRDPLR
jgi:hypothetical protein